jgi:hypothetical protein
MPHLWNDILVATKEELVPKFWNRLGSLQLEIWRNRNHPYGIKQIQKGGNGRQMLIVFASLPNEVQQAIGNPDKLKNPLEIYYKTDKTVVDYYTEFRREGRSLRAEEQERYVINASVLQAAILLEEKRISARNKLKGVRESILRDVTAFNPVLKKKYEKEHNLPSTLRHFNRVLNEFKTQGLYSMIKDPNGTGKQGHRKAYESTIEVLNSLLPT